MRLTWSTPDPAGLKEWLAAAGLPARGRGPIALAAATLAIARSPIGSRESLEATIVHDPEALSDGPSLAGLGWATVDAARLGGRSLEPLSDEAALGASSWVARGPRLEPWTIYIEPATEGLLAAALARHGEGPICLWLRGARPASAADMSPVTDGPLGRERLVAPRSRFGPFLLLLGD